MVRAAGRSRMHSEARRSRPLSPKYILFLKKRLAEQRESSQAALEIQSDKNLNGTDKDQATLVSGIDIQEELSSDIVSTTSKTHQGKHDLSSSKMHKPKAFLKKKKKKDKKKCSVVSTT